MSNVFSILIFQMINTYASKKNHHITKERLAVQEQTVTKGK